MKSSPADSCVYFTGKGKDLMLVIVYVDNLLIMSSKSTSIEKLKKHLFKQFEIKDLGETRGV